MGITHKSHIQIMIENKYLIKYKYICNYQLVWQLWPFENLKSFLLMKKSSVEIFRITFSIRDFSSEAVMFPSPSQSNSLNAFQRITLSRSYKELLLSKGRHLFKFLLGNSHFESPGITASRYQIAPNK